MTSARVWEQKANNGRNVHAATPVLAAITNLWMNQLMNWINEWTHQTQDNKDRIDATVAFQATLLLNTVVEIVASFPAPYILYKLTASSKFWDLFA